jgi:DNA polymerase-3 subunit alpha
VPIDYGDGEILKPFVHLHLHTEYSLLDGAAKIENLFDICKENNMPAAAITDHGAMYGVIDFYRAAKEHGIKAIIGCELYVAENMHDKQSKGENDHIILLAKDQKGYKNLIKLDSLAFTEGFYYKPRIDLDLLSQRSEGLVCLSGCIAGGVPRLLLAGQYDKAKELALKYKSIFAEGDYYIEIQDQGLKEQKYINPLLVKLAKEIGVKTVVTNDVHYLRQSDAEMQDVLLCVQTGKTLDDPLRLRFNSDQYYLKNYDEMLALFPDMEEALDNTLEIAQKCNVEIQFKMPLIPNYVPDNGMTPEAYLRQLAEEGIKKRYETVTEEIKKRLNYELSVINSMGFNEYYLIVWDFINYAKSVNIPVGPGRGSGVGSIVAFAIGITNVEPLRFNLLFERFLNPERKSMPDFDIDFCFERRGEVIEYVVKKYGSEKVTQIVTFGTMAAKAAIKDVARVYKIPYAEVDKITKLIPFGKVEIKKMLGIDKKEGDQTVPDLLQIYNEDKNIKRVIDMAMKLEGMPRNTSMHAAGVVICKEVLSDYIPLARNGQDITTQFTMTDIEKLGLLKMDFLGLRTLTDIKKTVDYVFEQKNIKIDFDKMDYSDKGVYELIGEGDTDAVFQLESAGMKRFMRELKPDCLEDIIAGNALFRPGPMDSIPKYIEGKKNPEKVTYKHPMLKQFLEVTYGCIVYQEQVMQIVQALAGFSLGQADIIRRAMGKKDAEEMKRQRHAFVYGKVDEKNGVNIEGAVKRGIPENIAIDIFNEMEGFAKYAFNKSHAAAYAVLTYQTGYLKKYHRVEFITAVLNNRITNIDEITKYINYARKCGIGVLQPDVNRSKTYFSVENGAIRFGLAAIKNCGENAVNMIIREREKNGEFKGLNDFLKRIDLSCINKRLLESFIYGGAFDCFGANRCQLIKVYENVLERVSADRKKTASGQYSLFEGIIEDTTLSDTYPDVPEFPSKQRLFAEREVLGVYVSGHPLEQYKKIYEDVTFDTSMLAAYNSHDDEEERTNGESLEGKEVLMAGLLSGIKKIITKAGKEMATARLEDIYGYIELLFFNKSYIKYREFLTDDNIVFVSGKLSAREDEQPKLIVDAVKPCGETAATAAQEGGRLYLRFSASKTEAVYEILESYPGGSDVIAKIDGEVKKFPLKAGFCPALKNELLSLMENEDIVFKK